MQSLWFTGVPTIPGIYFKNSLLLHTYLFRGFVLVSKVTLNWIEVSWLNGEMAIYLSEVFLFFEECQVEATPIGLA